MRRWRLSLDCPNLASQRPEIIDHGTGQCQRDAGRCGRPQALRRRRPLPDPGRAALAELRRPGSLITITESGSYLITIKCLEKPLRMERAARQAGAGQ